MTKNRNKTLLLPLLVCASTLASQFYVFASGLPQPAHLIAAAIIVIALAALRMPRALITKTNYVALNAFIIYSCLLNLLFATMYQEFEFVKSSIFFVFDVMLFYAIIVLYISDSRVKTGLLASAVMGLMSLALIWGIGLGSYETPPRYNAFFNDPNQMAFWCLSCFCIYFLLRGSRAGIIEKVSMFGLLSFLVVITMSRSGVLGLASIAIALLVGSAKTKGHLRTALLSVVPVAIVYMSLLLGNVTIEFDQFDTLMARLDTTNISAQAEDRGYSRISDYPEYVFFGSGQGLDSRFNSIVEIHSSWIGLLSYYGVPGFFLFMVFLVRTLYGLSLVNLLVVSGPLLYSFTTFSIRTPIFWVLMAAVVIVKIEGNVAISRRKAAAQRRQEISIMNEACP